MFGLTQLFQSIAGLASEINRMRNTFATANDELESRFGIAEPTLTIQVQTSTPSLPSPETVPAKTGKKPRN